MTRGVAAAPGWLTMTGMTGMTGMT
ncbi:GNAT family N-acetyltransferase, partial [Xanthomonas oryzae pv. oryzae]